MAIKILVHPDSFTAAFIISAAPKEKFGEPGVQDTNAAGVALWLADVAVSNPPENGRPQVSEVIRITVPAHKIGDIPSSGTPVTFHGLLAAVSQVRVKGDRAFGGDLRFSADAIRPAHQQSQQQKPAA